MEESMKRTLALVAIGFLVTGCGGGSGGGGGSDAADDTTTPPADTATPPADTATPPADTATPPADTATPPADTATPPATGGCNNDADKAIIAEKDLADIAKTCAISNLGNAPATLQCIKDGSGLSDTCVACFGGSVQCGQVCALPCAIVPDEAACDACLVENGCIKEFDDCSGLPPTE
jgi:hypothetical protein